MEICRIIDRKNQTIKKGVLSISVLASSSKGNAILVSDGVTSILIDAGLSGVKIENRLKAIGFNPKTLDAILVSHEHQDHIAGVGILSRRYNLPVYINDRTMKNAAKHIGKLAARIHFKCGTLFEIGSLSIHPFSVPHDAEDPACFTIKRNGVKIGIATDFGRATSVVKQHLRECNLLVLEANHDPGMLEKGPYPWPIKQRVKSRTGHLSNEEAKNLLSAVKHEKLSHVILAHISETNNTPQKALRIVREALDDACKTCVIAAVHGIKA